MPMKKLTDFKAYTEKKTQYDKASADLRELVSERERLATTLRESLARQGNDITARAALLLQGDYVNSEPLKRQIQDIDAALPVHERAVRIAEAEYEAARSAASHEICAEAKKDFVPYVQEIVAALKSIRAANKVLVDLRSGLEAAGVKTSSIPFCIFQRVGSEEDHRLGQSPLAIYIKSVKEAFNL